MLALSQTTGPVLMPGLPRVGIAWACQACRAGTPAVRASQTHGGRKSQVTALLYLGEKFSGSQALWKLHFFQSLRGWAGAAARPLAT